MRGHRLLVLATLGAALLVGPVPSEAVASACAPPSRGASSVGGPAVDVVADAGLAEETRIRWTHFHRQVVSGASATLQGQVVTEAGALPDERVDLWARAAGAAAWTMVASEHTDPETGVFRFDCLAPESSTAYRAVFEPTLTHAGSRAVRTVEVARRMPDALRQVGTARFVISGSVRPSYAARPVVLQRRSCARCSWRTVHRATTTQRSTWRLPIDASRLRGRHLFRALTPADTEHVASAGDHVWEITRR